MTIAWAIIVLTLALYVWTVTALRMAEAKARREGHLRDAILNSAPNGIIGLDQNGRATFVNDGAVAMLGRSHDEILGHNMHQLMHHTRRDGSPFPWEECPMYHALREGTAAGPIHEQFFRKDGTGIEVECACRPMRDENGAVTGVVISFHDISQRIAVERMKNEFVSVVSHELRTPLTAIRGALGLVAGGRVGEMPDRARRMLDIAVSNTDRLVRLINDILDLERIDSGKITLSRQRCDTTALMEAAVEDLRPVADKAGVTVQVCPCPTAVWADPDRIIQTLTNLIGNAVKFSPPDSVVVVSARALRSDVIFEVRDQGRGIPPEKLDSIFERFQQVDASDSREKGGSGLGLAISRSIVRQHGGRIWVESVLGRGSRFRFTISRAEASPVAESLTETQGLIMICDDDEAVREVVAAIIEVHGFRAIPVASGEELLAHPATREADAILLDMLMPGMTGWQTLAALRNDASTSHVPVVIISVLPPDQRLRGYLSGWVQKPLDEEAIVKCLQRAVGTSRRPRVLIVEEEGRSIANALGQYPIEAILASNGRDAIELASRDRPDAIVLDVALPESEGLVVVEWMKSNCRNAKIPLVVFSPAELGPADFDRSVIQLIDGLVWKEKEWTHVA